MAKSWYNIAPPASDGKPACISICDAVGGEEFPATGFIEALRAVGNVAEIEIEIHSPGGSIIDGLAVYNALKQHPAAKTVNVLGLAGSMASVIAMAGDKVRIPRNGLMFVHNPLTVSSGDSESLRKDAEMLDKMKQSIVSIYAEATGKSAEEIASMMDAETWMSGEEAVSAGFADECTDEVAAVAKLDVSRFSAKVDARVDGLWGEVKKPAPVDDLEAKLAVARAEGFAAGRDAREKEIAADLTGAHAAVNAASAEVAKLRSEIDAINKANAALLAKAEAAEKARADKEEQLADSLKQRAALLVAVNFKPEISWADALAKAGGNYAQARQQHPEAYAQYMAAANNRGQKPVK